MKNNVFPNPANTIYADQKAGLLPDEIINGRWHQ